MIIDLGSFAFGSSIKTGGGTPSWGTSIGQASPDYKITRDGAEEILIGMLYCSVPLETINLPIGKGGHVYKASVRKECQLASLFRKTFINGTPIDYPFIMVLFKEDSSFHSGRKSIKYSDKNEYQNGSEHYINQEFVAQARAKLGLSDDACWFVYKIEVHNQDELHLFAVIVDAKNNVTYEDSYERKDIWSRLIPDIDYLDYSMHIGFFKGSAPLQQIFYGAPGTGKSHEIKEKTQGRDVIRTTFHPDSDYSTFVGAYKPAMGHPKPIYGFDATGKTVKVEDPKGTIITEQKIEYKFVKQAFLKAYLKAWKNYIDGIMGSSVVSTTSLPGDEDGETYNPNLKNTKNETEPVETCSCTPVFLIIEEINRGNCAQIFGDIFQLLDRQDNGFSEYPIEPDTDIQKAIEDAFKNDKDFKLVNDIAVDGAVKDYTSNYGATLSKDIQEGKIMLLPPNLYIWATMNTSDQSLFPIDSAFKRRWEWEYIPIGYKNKDWEIKIGEKENEKKYKWVDFQRKINDRIYSIDNSEDKQLGDFFVDANRTGKIISADTLLNKILFYIWNDVCKDDPDQIFRWIDYKDKKEKSIRFSDFFTDDKDKKLQGLMSFLGIKAEGETEEEKPVILPDVEESDTDVAPKESVGE